MIEIVEVGPRDGLQNESVTLSTDAKAALIDKLVAAGANRIEIVSFAHPALVPQMADAEAVAERFAGRTDFSRIGLVMNERGFQRSLRVELDELNIPVGVTEGFNRANVGAAPADTVALIGAVVAESDRPVTGTISVAFGCPYDGEVSEAEVVDLAVRLAEAGCSELGIADTIGVADPWTVADRLRAVRDATGDIPLRVHFHDTRNTGIANAVAAIEAGVGVVDASVGGIGGCPFAPNATGNIATEDLVYALERGGRDTGLDPEGLLETARWLADECGIDPPSALLKAGGFPA